MFGFSLLLILYTVVALVMCVFIMANESGESLGNPSPISEVKSTQRGSIVEYIIWGLAISFILLSVVLSRLSKPSLVSRILREDPKELKQSANESLQVQQPEKSQPISEQIQAPVESKTLLADQPVSGSKNSSEIEAKGTTKHPEVDSIINSIIDEAKPNL